MKNINSFSSVREAIICEVARQTEILNNGGEILQETRRFDENTNETYSMRSKEDAIDDKEYTGSLISLLENADTFIKNNSKSLYV